MYSMSPFSGPLLSDEESIRKYNDEKQWGLHIAVDLGECDHDKICDGEYIKQFAIDLADHIKMKRYGEPIAVRFGAEPKVQGYSLIQLIETSCIAGHFAEDTDGLINGSMLYDRHLMQPMFKLSIGNPGSSFAVEIARKIGLPEVIITDAEQIVGSDYINMDKYLLDIARDKRYWENKRMSIRQKEKKIDERLAQYEEDATQLREKRREIINDAKEEARRILEGSNASIERTIHDIKRAQADKEKTLEARKKLQEAKEHLLDDNGNEHPLLKKAPKSKKEKVKTNRNSDDRPIAVGDNVKLDGQGTVGEVLEIEGKNATVAFGAIKTRVKTDRLKRTLAQAQSGAKANASIVSGATSDSQRARQLNFKQEIDVRGMRVDEAVQALTYYIDDAIRFNAGKVRILHGTGTGALRQYLRQYLDTVPGVKSCYDEHVQFGGAGITIVDLE